MPACEWDHCSLHDLYTLPRDSFPIVRSSQVEFRTMQFHEWKHKALHDPSVEHALRNASCCFKRNVKTTKDYPHTCFLADADHKVKLPAQCNQGLNQNSSCLCSLDSTPHMFCGKEKISGTMSPLCKNQTIGYEITCRQDNRITSITNTVAMNIPGNCALAP